MLWRARRREEQESRAPILEDVLAALLKREGVAEGKIAEVLKGKELDRILASRKA